MIELIVTMAVAAALLAVAVPGMREFRVRANVSTTTNDLVVAMNLARAEAVKRGRDVAVVANNGNWSEGWRVETVVNPEIISERLGVEAEYSVNAAAVPVGVAADRIIFGPTGALQTATGFDFNICRPDFDPGNEDSRRITVGATGNVRSRRDTTGSPAGTCA